MNIILNPLSPLSTILLLIAGFTAFFAIQAYRYRMVTGGLSFMILMTCISFYAAGYAFELASGDLPTALFFSNIQYFGIPFISFSYYSLTFKYLSHRNRSPVFLTIILLIVPLTTFTAHLTIRWHNLFYIAPELIFWKDMSILKFGKGPWYLVNNIYTLFIILLAIIHSTVRFIQDRQHRLQIVALVTGAIFPLAGYIVYMAGLSPEGIDTTPIAIGLSCPFMALSIFRFAFFDILPVARDHIVENLKDCIIVADSFDRLTDYNEMTRKVFPCILKYRIGSPIADIVEDCRRNKCGLASVFDSDTKKLTVGDGNGARHFSVFRDTMRRTQHYFGGSIYILSDITEQVRLYEQLDMMATTDALTGIYNRRKLLKTAESELSRALRYERPLGIIFMDIDHFKIINDSWGHQGGDFVLKKITRICSAMIRNTDLFGRYGGEEFALFLPETALTDCITAAEKLRNAVESAEFSYKGSLIEVTASFGVSEFQPGDTLETLMHRADKALYKAKMNGRNRVCS